MIDTTVLLSFLLRPLSFAWIYFGSSGISAIPPNHRPPLCQANHGKPLAVFGSTTFSSVDFVLGFGSFWFSGFWYGGFWFGGFQFGGFQIGGFSVWLCQLMVSDSVVAGSMVLLQLVVWHQILPLWVRWQRCFNQGIKFGTASGTVYQCLWNHQCHQDPRTQCCQPQCRESRWFVHAISVRSDNQPILKIN